MTQHRGLDPAAGRLHRTQTALHVLRTARELSRSQLAEKCGVSRPTAAAMLDDLINLGVYAAPQLPPTAAAQQHVTASPPHRA